MRYARAVRKVGHSEPPVGKFLGVGLPQGTIAIVYPCSINPPPSCVYVPLQMGTLRPVYGDTFSGCLPRGIIFCSHFSDPLLHSPWTLMLEIGCSTLAPMGCEFLPTHAYFCTFHNSCCEDRKGISLMAHGSTFLLPFGQRKRPLRLMRKRRILSFAKFVAKGTHQNAPRVTFTCVEVAWVNILAILMFPSSP